MEDGGWWMGRQVGEVLGGKLFQRGDQGLGLAGGSGGEGVGLELVLPRPRGGGAA